MIRGLVNNYFENYNILQGYDGKDLIRNILDEATLNQIEYVISDENMGIINGSVAMKFLRELEGKKLIQKRTYILASSDYQNYKEENWLKDLRGKYNVEVNQDVLEKVKSQLKK